MRSKSAFVVLLVTVALSCSHDSQGPLGPGLQKPPTASVRNLVTSKVTPSRVTLEWTAPVQTRDEGRMLVYDVRYATFPITDSTWQSASSYISPWFYFSDVMVGEQQSCTISHLRAGTTYYFGLKAEGNGKDWSPISNVATVTTKPNGSIEPINRLQSDGISTPLGIMGSSQSYLYVLESQLEHFPYTSLAAYDVSNPLQPARANWPQVIEYPFAMRATEDRLYVLSGLRNAYPYMVIPSKLQILRALPASPAILGSCIFDDSVFSIFDTNYAHNWVTNVVVDGDQLFVIRETNINVMDIRDVSNPFIRSTYTISDELRETNLLLAGSNLSWAIGRGSTTIGILDVSDPDNPTTKSIFQVGAVVHGIVIAGKTLYVFTQTHEIRIIDVSDLASPVLKSVLPLAWYTTSGAVQGNHLYITKPVGDYSVYAVSIADPATPTIVDSCDFPVDIDGIFADNNYLYAYGGYSSDVYILQSKLR